MGVQGWRVVVVCVPGHRQAAFGRAVVAVGHPQYSQERGKHDQLK